MNATVLCRPVLSLVLAAAALGFVSCASGPTYAEMKPKLPPIAKGQGRVFVYRPSSLGFGVKPSVKIDDKVIGTSEGQGFIYSDQSAGTHEISIKTEWTHKKKINVTAAQPCFIECAVTPGVLVGHVVPNQVWTPTGESNIQECKMPKVRAK